MVANCCICKSHPGQEADVTFHKIPKDEDRANEWIKLISGIGVNFSKTATICSKHFDDSQLQYKIVGGTIKRFLTPNAIPTKYVIATPCPRQSPSNCDEETARMGKDDTEDVMVEESVLHTQSIDTDDDETVNGNSALCKRQADSADNTDRKRAKRAKLKTVRCIGDISREDFVSNDVHDIVMNYISECKKAIKILKQKVRRMDTKIMTLKDLTDNLRSKNMLTSEAADFLQVGGGGASCDGGTL